MCDIRFFSYVKDGPLVDVIREINNNPETITLDNTSNEVEGDIDNMLRISPEEFSMTQLNNAFPEVEIVTKNYASHRIIEHIIMVIQ